MSDKHNIIVTCFPNDEWGFLLKGLELLVEDLQAVDPDLASSQTLVSLLVVANAFIGYIESGDKRIYVRDWMKHARAYLDAMQPAVH